MTEWDEDYINEEVPAFIEFDERRTAARSSSATSRDRSTAARPIGTGIPRSNSRGKVATGRRHAVDGPWLGNAPGRRTARHDLHPPGR